MGREKGQKGLEMGEEMICIFTKKNLTQNSGKGREKRREKGEEGREKGQE